MKLLNVKDVATIIQAKPSTIYAWAEQGTIPCFKLNGLLRFDLVEIEEWIKGSRIKDKPALLPKTRTVRAGNIDHIIKSAIASAKDPSYTSPVKGKPGQSSPERRD